MSVLLLPSDVAKRLGISRDSVIDLTRRKVLVPALHTESGYRLYTEEAVAAEIQRREEKATRRQGRRGRS